ncbi:MAG: DUF368 domain-containing protein [Christensenellaceae bacterium]|nr:DUF368 domain-containing protein [Christensenellaceae bacterium]
MQSWFPWIFRAIKGALIGVGAILPGISGGVLCVILGIYRPMMEFLANPIKQLKKQFTFFLPVLIGFGIGVVGLSRVVDWLFRTSQAPAVWLFIGLISGTIPSLYREAGQQGRNKSAWVSFVAGFVFMLTILLILRFSGKSQVTPSLLWWIICGILWGIGLVVPGMSPSSLFIFLGLYQPMSAGIAALNMSIIIPMGIGLALTVATLAKGMQKLLTSSYAITMHAVLGITIASTLMIIPLDASYSLRDIITYAICFVLGLIIAVLMSNASEHIDEQKSE